MNILEVDDTYIKGEAEIEEAGVLFTSIPYYRGFSAFVDGEKTDIISVENAALISVRLSEGRHIVELKYVPYGFVIGLMITGIGISLAVVYMIIRYRNGERKV